MNSGIGGENYGSVRWEAIAAGRWGSYISCIERDAIVSAMQSAAGPGNSLDVGCGSGRWSEVVQAQGWKTTCLETNKQRLDYCRKRLPEAECVHVLREDTRFPCASESKDLILCIEVPDVMHAPWFAGEVRRVLRPGGSLVGVFFNLSSWRGYFANGGKNQNIYQKSYHTWKSALAKDGFSFQYERGLCWCPFSRESNSPLIPLCTTMELVLGLRFITRYSPWIAFSAQRRPVSYF